MLRRLPRGKVGDYARAGVQLTLWDDNRALGSCMGETEAPGRLRSALKLQKLSGKQLRGHHVKVTEKAFVCEAESCCSRDARVRACERRSMRGCEGVS